MNLKDLPVSVTFSLDEDSGVDYPVNGDFETSFELELLCFGKKNYLKTWPLRQRMMDVIGDLVSKLDSLSNRNQESKEEAEENITMNADELRAMCMFGGFDLICAMEEFKQLVIAGNLIKIDDNVFMNKARWEKVDDVTKEQIFFTYMANFIQPCVLK